MSLSIETKSVLAKMISLHEGRRPHVYFDTKKIATIACGRNVSATGPGLRESEMDFMLDNDISYLEDAWNKKYSWFNTLSDARKCALIDFSFCGMGTVSDFHSMLLALSEGKFDDAANELLDSSYAKEVGQRAITLAKILRTDKLSF